MPSENEPAVTRRFEAEETLKAAGRAKFLRPDEASKAVEAVPVATRKVGKVPDPGARYKTTIGGLPHRDQSGRFAATVLRAK
jgi:hypothetical protein